MFMKFSKRIFNVCANGHEPQKGKTREKKGEKTKRSNVGGEDNDTSY